MTARRKNALWVALAGLLVAGLAFVFLGRVFVSGESAPGTVIEEKKGSQGNCWPVLEYEVAGRTLRAEPAVRVSGECGTWSPGRRVTVHYWPNEPDRPSLLSVGRMIVPALVPLALLGFALYLALSKEREGVSGNS